MPVVDTEVLFALSPRDPKHAKATQWLGTPGRLRVTDTALLEFQLVLRGRGRRAEDVRAAILALASALAEHEVEQVRTLDTTLLARQGDLEGKYRLSYFDSLLAASALAVDGEIVSDDRAFDRVSGLRRSALT
jgi:predicted nucleic acid-binding protein